MLRELCLLLIGLFVLAILPSYVLAESKIQSDSVRIHALLNEVDDLWRGKSSYSITSMQVKTEHYTRTMRMEGWSKGKEHTLIRIIEPLREKGTATLKFG